MHLHWIFEHETTGARATAPHGTYAFIMMENGHWKATFTSADSQPYRRRQYPVGPASVWYRSPGEAMRACQRHADSFDSDAASPFTAEALP